jgi:hypothetical protein
VLKTGKSPIKEYEVIKEPLPKKELQSLSQYYKGVGQEPYATYGKIYDEFGRLKVAPAKYAQGMERPVLPIYKKPEQPVILQRNNGNLRLDGTPKGKGFFGEIKRPDGKVSTELSISSEDVVQGKEVLIPTMVPTLTNAEVSYLLSGKYNPQARQGIDDVISRKAIDFARKRAANKQPFFATPQEEGKAVPFVPPPPDMLQTRQAPMNVAPSWTAPAPNVAPAPMAKPTQGMNPIWGPGPRYSIKDEGVKQMLRAIQNIKRK